MEFASSSFSLGSGGILFIAGPMSCMLTFEPIDSYKRDTMQYINIE